MLHNLYFTLFIDCSITSVNNLKHIHSVYEKVKEILLIQEEVAMFNRY